MKSLVQQAFTVEFSKDELQILNHFLKEIRNGLTVMPKEFKVEQACLLIEKIYQHKTYTIALSCDEISIIIATLSIILDRDLLIQISAREDEVNSFLKRISQIYRSLFFNQWTTKLDANPTTLTISSDSQILLLGTKQGSIYAYELKSGKLLMQNLESKGAILALLLQDQSLYSFDSTGLLTQWLFPAMKILNRCHIIKQETQTFSPWEDERIIQTKKKQTFSHALFKPNDLSLLVVVSEMGLYLENDSKLFQVPINALKDFNSFELDPTQALRLPEADADNQIDALTLSKDGHQLIVTSCTSASSTAGDWTHGCPEYISVFGNHFFECRYNDGNSPPRHEKNVAAFSPDANQLIVSSSHDDTFYLFNAPSTGITSTKDKTESKTANYRFEPLDDKSSSSTSWPTITSLDWAATGDLFAAGGSNGLTIFWTSVDCKQLWSQKMFNASIEHLMFSPDGTLCILLTSSGEVAVMNKFKH